jgi:hypothetical protein
MRSHASAQVAAVLAAACCVLGVAPPASLAATREPLARALDQPRSLTFGFGDSRVRPDPAALREMARSSARRFAGADEFHISSTHYGPAAVSSVAATLRSLDHGPEMSSLNVYVATPDEIRETCGAAVVACYVPSESEMVVSGVDRPVAGTPRAFAIAHEYGHHIANSQRSSALPALEAGTIRWATYERVCELTRAGRLFPGDQDAHYWEDPEEAFAQSYADLNRPGAGVSWQYTPLLQPSAASLARIHADVSRPWTGPVTTAWSGSLTAPPEAPMAASSGVAGSPSVGAGRAVAGRGWIDSDAIRTPLDGPVSVSFAASPGAELVVVLRDPVRGRVLARALTDAEGRANLSYSNCGHASLLLEARSSAGAGSFRAAITRP